MGIDCRRSVLRGAVAGRPHLRRSAGQWSGRLCPGRPRKSRAAAGIRLVDVGADAGDTLGPRGVWRIRARQGHQDVGKIGRTPGSFGRVSRIPRYPGPSAPRGTRPPWGSGLREPSELPRQRAALSAADREPGKLDAAGVRTVRPAVERRGGGAGGWRRSQHSPGESRLVFAGALDPLCCRGSGGRYPVGSSGRSGHFCRADTGGDFGSPPRSWAEV